MYLRHIKLLNTGPIKHFEWALPFHENGLPKPAVLVGRNGSGKSTLMSFVANALIGMKQMVFEETEVERGKVYRMRSGLAIHTGQEYFFAKLDLDSGVALREWTLARPKAEFTDSVSMAAIDPSWAAIPENEFSHFHLVPGELNPPYKLEAMLAKHCFLFFPADRFEPPDWLNVEGLSPELRLPEQVRMKGRTARRIVARNRLKPTLDWLFSVIYDANALEFQTMTLSLAPGTPASVTVMVPTSGPAHSALNSILEILKCLLCERDSDQIRISVGPRSHRVITVTVIRDGQPIRVIGDLTSLSAGESALFCMFTSIIRDLDLASGAVNSSADISGIVIVDEGDLHLHISHQYQVLPRLIKMFPKVQFIVTAHAPMVAVGLENVFGADGFEILEMPTGVRITPEVYGEFRSAFEVFAETKTFQAAVARKLQQGVLPAIIFEGKSDVTIVRTAWDKLHPGIVLPFEPIPSGVEVSVDERNGGAEVLRRCIDYLPIVTDRPCVAVFDFDRKGYEQFNGVSQKTFAAGIDRFHKKHATKDMHAILLPVPSCRDGFVNLAKPINSYLSIEHYFSDTVLRTADFNLDPVVSGSLAFEIDASPKAKSKFAEHVATLDPSDFGEFQLLFDRLAALGIPMASANGG